METTVTKEGRTAIPAEIRRRHSIEAGTRLVWLDDGVTIKVVPVPADPIAALRGSGRGEGLVRALLEGRRREREK